MLYRMLTTLFLQQLFFLDWSLLYEHDLLVLLLSYFLFAVYLYCCHGCIASIDVWAEKFLLVNFYMNQVTKATQK